MSKNSKIIVTLIPNGYSKGQLNFSISLSPRLPDTGLLGDYYEMLYWPNFANKARLFKKPLEVKFYERKVVGDSLVVNTEGKKVTKAYQLNFNPDQLWPLPDANKFWHSAFGRDTPVSGWLFDESRFDYAKLLDNSEFRASVVEIIDKKILEISDGFSPKEDGMEPDFDGSLTYRERYSVLNNLHEIRDWASNHVEILLEKLRERSLSEIPYQHIYKQILDEIVIQFTIREERLKTLLAGLKDEKEVVRLNRLNGEFHKQFSILGAYPKILRGVGWIIDGSIKVGVDGDLFHLLNNLSQGSGKGFVKITSPFSDSDQGDVPLAKFYDEIEFLYTFSAFKFSSARNSFEYDYYPKDLSTLANSNGEEFNDDFLVVDDGYLLTKYKNGDLQVYTEMVGQSYFNALLDFMHHEGDEQQSKSKNNNEGVGISVNVKNLASRIQRQMDKPPIENIDKKDNSYIIWGHHVDIGYKVNVAAMHMDELYKVSKTLIKSLVDRHTEVYIGDKSLVIPEDSKSEYGYITESFQDGKSVQPGVDQKLIDDQIFKWTGWNLVCPLIKQSIKKSPTSEENSLRFIQTVPQHSLTTLRFKWWYSFQLAVVDICGNSKNLQENAEKDILKPQVEQWIFDSLAIGQSPQSNPGAWNNNTWTVPIQYLRTDGIDTPSIFFSTSQRYQATEDPYTLVIYSSFKRRRNTRHREVAGRCIAPPRVNQYFASLHGVLDPYLSLREELRRRQYFVDSIKIGNSVVPKAVQPRHQVDFFVDPAVDQYMFSQENSPIGLNEKLSVYPKKRNAPFGADYLLVELKQKKDRGENLGGFELKKRAITFNLAPGVEFRNTTESYGLNYGPVLVKSVADECEGLTYFSNINPNVAEMKLNLIHAVQYPCLIFHKYSHGEIFQPVINAKSHYVDRRFKTTNVLLRAVYDFFPTLTAVSFDLIADYCEWSGDVTHQGSRKEKERKRQIVKSNILLADHFDKLNPQDPKCSEVDVTLRPALLEHNFSSTKHYKVEYSLRIFSKFKDYFLKINPKENCSIIGHIQNKGTFVNLKNTEVPPPLSIESTVPTIAWERLEHGTRRKSDKVTFTRICNHFRIYFKGDWFLTGEGEKVALIFDPECNTVDSPKDLFCSQVGYDPAHHAVQKTSNLQFNEQLVDKNFTSNPGANPITIFHPTTSLGMPPPDTSTSVCIPNSPLKAILYDVKADKKKKRWFMDFAYDPAKIPKDGYGLFFKLALSRYQQDSLVSVKENIDCQFSPPALTNFFQGFPIRSITIDRLAGSILFTWEQIAENRTSFKPNEVHAYNVALKDSFENLKNEATNRVDFPLNESYKTIKLLDYKKQKSDQIFVVEEYEHYPDNNFLISDTNPRDNYQKRLIFYFKFMIDRTGQIVPL